MDVIEIVYLSCFFLGLGFAIITGLLSGAIGGGADVDAGGLDAGHGLSGGDVHFSPWSPVVLSMFVASFGGAGLILKKLGFGPWVHIPAATAAGLVLAAMTFYIFWKIVSSTSQSSEPRVSDLVGIEAEVITPIPVNGVGEIGYTARQQRFSAPARAVDNREIPARAIVRISKIVSNTYYVERTS